MSADDSISFSESISSQTTGAVFVFSEYNSDTGAYNNQGFWTRFIPKCIVSAHSGRFFQFSEPTWYGGDTVFLKGMWINDTGASGHACSAYSSDPYRSSGCCLRYVIGV